MEHAHRLHLVFMLTFFLPGTLWNMLCESGSVFSALVRSYDLQTGLLNSVAARDSLACNVYMQKFSTHFKSGCSGGTNRVKRKKKGSAVVRIDCSSSSSSSSDDEGGSSGDESGSRRRGGLQSALDVLCASSLSERTRNDLPSAFRVEVTMRNINWLLQYWDCTPPLRMCESERDGGVGQPWDYTRCYPNPVCDQYGFKARKPKDSGCKKKAKTSTKKGKASSSSSLPSIQWLDEGDEEDGYSSGCGSDKGGKADERDRD